MVHSPSYMRETFIAWVNDGLLETARVEVSYEEQAWDARDLLVQMAESTDVIPWEVCEEISERSGAEVRRGASYGDAARTLLAADDSATVETREMLGEYFADQAAWRAGKAEEYPDDARNERAAEGLRELADHVRDLDPQDERLVVLTALTRLMGGVGGLYSPYEEANRLAGQFRFRDGHQDADELLTEFVAAEVRGRREFVEEHGGLADVG